MMIQNQGQIFPNPLRASQGSPSNMRQTPQNYQGNNFITQQPQGFQQQQQSTNKIITQYTSSQQGQYLTSPQTQPFYAQMQTQPQQQTMYVQVPVQQPAITNYVPLTVTQQIQKPPVMYHQNQLGDNSSSSSESHYPIQQFQKTETYSLPLNDNQILQQELARARQRVAELEKQLIVLGPEVDLWRQKFQGREQELYQLRQSQLQQKSEEKSSLNEQKQLEIRDLVQINQQLTQKLKEQQQQIQSMQQSQSQSPAKQLNQSISISQTLQFIDLENSEVVTDLKRQLEGKSNELEATKLEKIRLEKQNTSLLSEIKALQLQAQRKPSQQQQQSRGCM